MAGLSSGSDLLQKSLSQQAAVNDGDVFIKGWKAPDNDAVEAESQSKQCFASKSCCAWLVVMLGLSLLLSLVVGGIYYTFFLCNLPEAELHRLDISRFNMTYSPAGKGAFLTSDFTVHINLTNDGGRLGLGYGPMTASVSSMGVEFPDVHLDSMRLSADGDTELKVRSCVDKMAVEEAAGRRLEESAKAHMMVIHVVVKGLLDFYFQDIRMQGFPFRIDCHSIDQWEIDNGHAPPCNVEILPAS